MSVWMTEVFEREMLQRTLLYKQLENVNGVGELKRDLESFMREYNIAKDTHKRAYDKRNKPMMVPKS